MRKSMLKLHLPDMMLHQRVNLSGAALLYNAREAYQIFSDSGDVLRSTDALYLSNFIP